MYKNLSAKFVGIRVMHVLLKTVRYTPVLTICLLFLVLSLVARKTPRYPVHYQGTINNSEKQYRSSNTTKKITLLAYTTAQAGDWAASTTWVGGVVPGAGADVTLAHAITVNTSNYSANTNSITINTGASLTLGATDTVQFNSLVNNGTVNLGSAGVLAMYGSTPVWNNNGAFVYGTGTVSFNGTSANTVNGQNKFYNVVVKGNVSLAGDTVYGAIQVIPLGSFTGNPVGFESLPSVPAGQAITIYASPSGSGSGSGFSSFLPVNINRAKAVVKNYPANPCTVLLQDGTYYQLTLDSTDTRQVANPVIYKAINRGAVKFQPLKTINRADFQNIPDSIKTRIVDSTAKTKVKQLSLTSYAFSAKSVAGWPNVFADSGRVTPQFYQNGNLLPLSRYPNSDYMKMNGVIVKGNNRLDTPGVFYYGDTRTKYWTKAIADGGLWLAGNWCVPWSLQYIKTASIDTVNKIITQTNGVQNGLGYKFSAAKPPGSYNEPYFVSNIVEEIDTVGEWSINFRTKMLYMWVPDNGTIQYGDSLTMPAISVTKANNTQFQNIYFEGGAGSAVVINNASFVRIAGCDFTGCTNDAVLINDSYNCTVQSNDFHQVGAGGVKMNSSTYSKTDVFTLKRNNHTVINNYFYDYAQQLPLYNAAIDPGSTIGNYIANNKVSKSPHIGIAYGFGTGNNSLFEYNEVDSTVMVFHDMGAMYGTGKYIDRGHKFNHNYLHDNIAGVGANGLYLDNFTSGDTCVNNIVANVLNGMVNNGGVGNRFFNNVVINALRPVSTNYEPDSSRYVTLRNTYYNANAANFRSAYPELVDAVDTLQRDTLTINSEYWSQFKGNAFFTFSPTNNNSIFTYVPDNNVFNADGTNNNAWCSNPLNDAFKKWKTIFLDNFKSTNKLKNAIYPFQMDSLRAPGILNLTGGSTDWHINRIGLYTDSFRTTLGKLGVNGIAPKMKMTVTSNNNHLFNTDTTTLTVVVTNPNINNCISSYQFFDNNTALSGFTINKTVVSYDTVVFTAVWPNVPKGMHTITFKVNDAPNWQYTTAPYAFSTDTAVYWTGAVNNAWSNDANWSSGTVPTATQPVVIPAAGITNWPVISGDSATAHRINIKGGASIAINANLQVAGPIKFDGNNIAISGNAIIKTSDTTLNPLPSGINWGNIKVMYNSTLAPQTIVGGTFGGLLIQQSIVGNTDYASGDIQVNGNWQLAAGDTLDMGIYALNGNVNAPVAIGGCVKTKCTAANPLPTGITYTGTVCYNAATGTQNVMLGSYNQLDLSGGADRVLAPGGRITVSGNLIGATGNMTATNDTLVLTSNHIISGNIGLNHLIINSGAAVSMPSGNLSFSGNFINNGTFAAAGGTVQLIGTKQTITGANTFNHFTKTVAVTDTLTLPAGLTQTINGNLSLNGAAGKVLYVLSSTAGNKAFLLANGTKNVTFAAIKDNQNSGSTPIVTTNSYDFGNNVNWTFGASSTYTWIGAVDSTWTNVNNWVPAQLPQATDSVVVDRIGNYQLAFEQSRSIAGFTIKRNNTVSLKANTLTLTGDIWCFGALNSTSGNLVIADSTTIRGDSLGALNLNHLTINNGALLTSGSNVPINISGNWNNNGNYVTGTEEVSFTGNTAQTISKVGGETFGKLTISNSANTVTANNNITLTSIGRVKIVSGANFDLGTNLLLGGATTNFTEGTGRLFTKNTSANPVPAGKTWSFDVVYNNPTGNQSVQRGTYNGVLSVTNTSGIDTLTGNIIVGNAINVGTGAALDAKLYTISGTLTGSTGSGTLYLGANNSTAGVFQIPLAKTWSGTVIFNGVGAYINHRIPPGNYNNLQLDVIAGGGIQFGNQTTETGTIRVAGTLTTSSTSFTPNQTTFEFGGTNQSIPASISFYNLVLSGSGTSFPSGNINISNSFNPGAVSGATQGTITFNGTGSQTIPAFNFNNLTISGTRNGNMVLSSGATIGIAGTFNASATFTSGGYITTNNTVHFNGNAVQTIPRLVSNATYNYGSIRISNNAGVNFGANLAVNKDVILNNGILNINSKVDSIGGNIVVIGGKLNAKTGTLVLNGTNAQTIDANAFAGDSVTVLTINNAAGVTSNANINIFSALNLTNGVLTANNNGVAMRGTATISGASSNSYINGRLTLPVSSQTAIVFPLGSGGTYRPVTFNYASAPGSQTVGIKPFEGLIPNIPDTMSTGRYGTKYWNIQQSAIGIPYFISINVGTNAPVANTRMLRREGAGTIGLVAITYNNPTIANTSQFTTTNTSNDIAIGEYQIPVTITGVTPNNKVYDGTNAATINGTLQGVFAGDSVTLMPTASFASKHVGNNLPVTAACTLIGSRSKAYVLQAQPTVGNANITPKPLTVTAVIDTITYDGTTVSTKTPAFSLVAGDVVATNPVQSFNNRNAGTGKLLTPSGLAINDGNNGNNYIINYLPQNIGVIKPKAVVVTAQSATKTYDGNTSSIGVPTVNAGGLVNGDIALFSQSFAAKNVGAGITLIPAGYIDDNNNGNNYSYSFVNNINGVIQAKTIQAQATVDNRQYNATTSATASITLNGVVNGDGVTANYTAANFNSKNVGNNKPVQVSGLFLTGTDAGNYQLQSTTVDTIANINPFPLTITVGADNKTYDGNTNAQPTFSTQNLFAGDVVGFTYTNAAFDNKNVGTNKTVTISGISLTGTDAANYTISGNTANPYAAITSRTLTVSADPTNKVYDGNSTATVSLRDDRVVGDNISVSYTASFNNKNVGIAKTVTVSGMAINGNDAANYTLAANAVDAFANISRANLRVRANPNSKNYDGTATANVSLALDSVLLGDAVSATYATAVFDDKNVGNGKTVTVSGISINGTDAPNYNLIATSVDTFANISPATVILTASNQSKNVQGYLNLGNTAFTATGLLQGDNITSVTLLSNNLPYSPTTDNIGTYAIVPSAAQGSGLGNYAINYVNGTLTVRKTSMYVWTGAADATWSNAANWNLNSLPTPIDSVTVTKTGANNLSIDQSATVAYVAISAGNSVALNGNTLTVTGNWINNGTFNGNTGTNVFAYATTTSGNSSFNHVVINNGANLTFGASSNNLVSGNWTNNGTFTAATGTTVTFNGTALQSITKASGTENFNSLSIANNTVKVLAQTNIALSATGTLTINNANLDMGSYALSGGATSSFTSGSGGALYTQNQSAAPLPSGRVWAFDVVYNNATGNQSVQSGTYNGTLSILNTSGLDTLVGNTAINGTFNLGTGAALDAKLYSITGTLAGSTGNGTLYLGGNNASAGFYQIPLNKTWSGKVVFNGVGAYINHRIPPGNYNDLQLDVAAGATQFGNQSTETGTIKVAGTLTTSSTQFTPNQTTFEFSGTNQSIPAAMSFYNLRLSGTGTTFPNANINVSNNFIPGTINTATQGTITFNGTGAQTVPAFNYNHITISGARTSNSVTLANGGIIGVAGTFTTSATFTTGAYVVTNNTIQYNGTGAQSVAAFQYNHLNIAGSRGANNVTLPGTTVSVAGNFTHNASYTTGLLSAGTGTVAFNGTSAQTLSVPTATTLSKLTINNTTSGGGSVQLNGGALTVASTLILTAGKLDLTGNNLTLNSGVTVSTPSANSYIVASGAGKLIRKSVTTATLFPIGTATTYTPVTLTNSAAADMTVGVSPVITNAVADTSRIVKLQWSIAASANVSATTALYQFNAANMASAFSATSACDHGWYNTSYNVSAVGTPSFASGVYTLQKTGLPLASGVTYLTVLGNTNAIQMPYVWHNTAVK